MLDSEPFGQRAVRLGMATSDQVRQALDTQEMLGQKSGLLGEILVEMGWLNPQDYMNIVLSLVEEADGVSRSHSELQEEFVRTALERGCIDERAVEQATKIQSGYVRKIRLIGQVMVDMGFLNDQQCERILQTYRDNDKKT
ncbi:MAG: hypothetical protein J7M19_08250 [Planctomycetes bacterium]|nr:hypothetical protein [Planctomycetota bacterium]